MLLLHAVCYVVVHIKLPLFIMPVMTLKMLILERLITLESITVEKSICYMYGQNYLLPYDNFHKTGINAYVTGFAMKRLFHTLTY